MLEWKVISPSFFSLCLCCSPLPVAWKPFELHH
jgi:hypothetical protein